MSEYVPTIDRVVEGEDRRPIAYAPLRHHLRSSEFSLRSSVVWIMGCLALAWVIASPQISAAATGGQAKETTTKPSAPEPSPDIKVQSQENVDLAPMAEQETESPLAADLEGDECCPAEEPCFACCCGPPGRFWIRGDYLLWWTKGVWLPPLVTTSDQDDEGILGRPSTEILFGNQWVNTGSRSNARISGGFWLDCGRTSAVVLDWFSLGRAASHFAAYSDGDPVLSRPFFDVLTEEQSREPVAADEEELKLRGTVTGLADDCFQSGGIGLRFNLCCHRPCCDPCCCEEVSCGRSCGCALCRGFGGFDCWRVDLVGGYRAYRLDEDVRVDESIYVIEQPEVPEGSTYNIRDEFHTKNEFHGGEVGLVGQCYRGRWSFELGAKVALGNNSRIVDITGHTLITRPGDEPATYDSGVLALEGTNVGRYVDDGFVAIPEINFELGYQLTCRMRAYVGYNFLYWARVVHAADQVNLNVNPSYFPGEEHEGDPAPTFAFNKGDFWAQGLNFGLELRY